MDAQDLYKMKLHEVVVIRKDFIWVMRVIGGWIYYIQQSIKSPSPYSGGVPIPIEISTTSVFVPIISNYEGYDKWLESQEPQYPEPEPNDEQVMDEQLLTLGHY